MEASALLSFASLAGFGHTGAAFRPRDPRRAADDTLAQSKAAPPLRGRRVRIPGPRLEQTGACGQVLVLGQRTDCGLWRAAHARPLSPSALRGHLRRSACRMCPADRV